MAAVASLHSFRLAVLPPVDRIRSGVCILINVVHDDSVETHIEALTRQGHDLFVRAFGLESTPTSPADLTSLILRHRVRENTFFLGNINRTVNEIRREDTLRSAVIDYVAAEIDRRRWDQNTKPERIRRDVRDFFLAKPDVPARSRCDGLPRLAHALRILDLLGTFLFFPFIGMLAIDIRRAIGRIERSWLRRIAWLTYGVWWLYGAIPTAAGYLVTRYLEWTEREIFADSPDDQVVTELELTENRSTKNAVTIDFDVRNTCLRRWYLWMILRGAELGCRHFWTDGQLTGIGTIHYARLVQIDGGRRLLFMSDYDGSLNRYLDDFLTVGTRAVISFTSSLVGCPKTKWLFQMHDRRVFGPLWKTMIRRYQLPTAVWYHAYPTLTVREIRNNAELRNELFAERLTDPQLSSWLRRL